MIKLSTKRITVTGGIGLLGTHLFRNLQEKRECHNVYIANLPEYDLRRIEDIKNMYDRQQPEIVIHLAVVFGGIGANRDKPGKFFFDNAIMGL